MSASTFITLLRKNSVYNVEESLKQCKVEGYYFPLGENWIGYCYKDFEKNYKRVGKKLSESSPVLSFYASEDYGWGFSFFQQGKEITKLDIELGIDPSSIQKTLDKADFEPFLNLVEDRQEFGRIKQALALQYLSLDDPLHGAVRFLHVLGLPDLTNVTYENIDANHVELEQIVRVGNPKRRIDVRKITEDVFRDVMDRHHLTYISRNPQSSADFGLYRNDNGIILGIEFYTDARGPIYKSISCNIKTCCIEYSLDFLKYKRRLLHEYGNEVEFRSILKEFVETFTEYAEPIFLRETLTPFDLESLYDLEIDSLFGEIGFVRIGSNQLTFCGGSIEYGFGERRLAIRHHHRYHIVSIEVRIDGEMVGLDRIHDYMYTKRMCFTNKHEYVDVIQSLIQILKEVYLAS
ncbi:MAG TPA: hypothetical protein VEZ72_03245 [Paenibacillus sp.]|nr:hypothetical protein [Paenibacillus sp.]